VYENPPENTALAQRIRFGRIEGGRKAGHSTMPKARAQASRVTFDQFVEVTFSAMLRALEARKLPTGPILIGIIWRPEAGARGGIGQPLGRAAED